MTEPTPFEVHASGALLHGTKADLKVGDLLEPGRRSNYGEDRTANHVYITATLDAATWGAELAVGNQQLLPARGLRQKREHVLLCGCDSPTPRR
jgi:hypothetical protein